MKKILAIIFTCLFITTSAYADIKVMFMSISPWGGAYPSYSVTMPDMSKADVRLALGNPWRDYAYSDVWLGGDQIYIMYYDVMHQPTTVVILPVTSW